MLEKNVLGKRIRALRQQFGYSQVDLASKLQLSNTTLSQYESGARIPSDDIKIQIATVFQVSLDYLLGQTNFPAPAAKKITPHEFIKELVAEYGKGADTALNLFAQLDAIDRGRIIGNMEVLLTDSKYSAKEELNNA